MHFTIEKIIKYLSSYFRSCISSNNNTDRKLQELFHAFVNLCIPFGDKFADARSIFVCLCIWVCLLLMHQESLKQILGISRNLFVANWIKATMHMSSIGLVWGSTIHHSWLISQYICYQFCLPRVIISTLPVPEVKLVLTATHYTRRGIITPR